MTNNEDINGAPEMGYSLSTLALLPTENPGAKLLVTYEKSGQGIGLKIYFNF